MGTTTPFKVFRMWYNTSLQRILRMISGGDGEDVARSDSRSLRRTLPCGRHGPGDAWSGCCGRSDWIRSSRTPDRRQYTKQLLFSQVVAVMAAVATRTHGSVHAAYLAVKDRLGVSAGRPLRQAQPARSWGSRRPWSARPRRCRQGHRCHACRHEGDPAGVRGLLPRRQPLASTEHRLAELRVTREGPLPGQSLALLDARGG